MTVLRRCRTDCRGMWGAGSQVWMGTGDGWGTWGQCHCSSVTLLCVPTEPAKQILQQLGRMKVKLGGGGLPPLAAPSRC